MLAYNNLKEIVQTLPILASVIFILCAFIPFKFNRYSGILMVLCASIVSIGYFIIAESSFDYLLAIIWVFITMIVGWSSYCNYKNYKILKSIESQYRMAMLKDLYITKLMNEGKYEPYEKPECSD